VQTRWRPHYAPQIHSRESAERNYKKKARNAEMKRFVYLLTLVALLQVATAKNSLAQSDKGGLTGHVFDSSGGVLQGAEIELSPGNAVVVSDQQGSYFVNGLNPGNYTITVTYVGFALFTRSFEITAGKATNLDVNMEVSSQKDQVLVTAERASGEAEQVNRQRTADNIVQVLTNEVITSLPNANIADALGRLPSVTLERDEGEGKYVQVRGTEPRLTNATIDGVNIPSPESGVRQIKFDAIPSDIVESVEINKTLQANMDGDGIGGSVNLKTKTATERPTISIFGLGGISPILGGRNNYTTTATIGKRFGSSKKFGALGGFSYDYEGRGIDDVEPVPDIATLPSGSAVRLFDSQDFREYKYYRTRYGAAGSTDYQLGQASNIYLRGLYSLFHNFGDRWVYTFHDNSGLPTLQSTGGLPSFNNSTRRPRYTIASMVLGGKHVLTNTWFSWDVSGSFASENDDGYGQGSFGIPNQSTYGSSPCTYDPVATGNSMTPKWSQACYTEAYNPSIYALNDVNISRGKTAQTNIQFAGAVGRRYHLGSHLATIEIGGKFRNANKYDHSYADDYAVPTIGGNGNNANDYAEIIPFSLFPNSFHNPGYYNGAYPQGPFADYFKTQAYAFANPSQFTFTTGAAGQSNFYSYIEKVSAGYVMNTVDFNKFRFVAGLRVEGTNLTTHTWQNGCTDPTVCPTIIQPGQNLRLGGDYIQVLPSGSLRYAVTNNDNFRLVFSRGLSRPNPQDIAQAFSITPAAGGTGNISYGNPGLKAETANNYDFLFEHYMNTLGAIQAGVFYKSIYDPIVSGSKTVQNFTPPPPYQNQTGTYIISQPLNAGSAHLFGFEIAYLQHFSTLPGLLGGFGISANYGYTDSGTGGLPGRSDHPHLLRQAPHTWNISPTYDRGRFSYRLGISYNAANIFSYQYQDGTPGGINGPLSDTYLYPHMQFDMQGSARLEKGFTFVAYILNVSNEVFGFYNGSSQYLIQREFYKPTYALGLRWNLRRE
jgi:TonB-dependent receptor